MKYRTIILKWGFSEATFHDKTLEEAKLVAGFIGYKGEPKWYEFWKPKLEITLYV